MSKISELSDGGSLQSTDYLIAVRSGGNVKVQADGNLSLGTVTAEGLTVTDDAAAGTSEQIFIRGSSDNNKQLRLGFDTTSNYGIIQALIEGTDWQSLALNPYGGNVGIGTNTPASGLDVSNGGSGAVGEQMRITSTTANSKLAFVNTGGNGAITQSSGAMIFQTNTANTERMRLDDSGNLGVGTQNPARTLHVNDVMRLEPRATAPSSPSAGDIFFNSSTNKLQCYDGTAWQDCF